MTTGLTQLRRQLNKPPLHHRSTVESTCIFRGVCAPARSGMDTKHHAMEKFEDYRFSTHELVQILRTADSMVHNHRESDSPTTGTLKQSLLPTTIVLSPGGITLVLPFFLFFQNPWFPVVRLLERQTVMVGSHNPPKQGLPVVGKSRLLLHASLSSRKKKLFPKYDDPETVSPHSY
jgi:hypothetical protein